MRRLLISTLIFYSFGLYADLVIVLDRPKAELSDNALKALVDMKRAIKTEGVTVQILDPGEVAKPAQDKDKPAS